MIIKKIEQWWLHEQFNREQQLLFLGVFFSLLKHGVGVTETLDKMSVADNKCWAEAAKSANKKLFDGVSISDAFRDWFDRSLCIALKAPEKTTQFAELGAKVVTSFRQEKINHGAWIGKLIVPCFYVPMILGIYALLSRIFYPIMAEISPIVPGGASYWVNLIGSVIAVSWPLFLLVLIAIVMAAYYLLPRWVSPLRQRMDQYLPLSLYRVVESAHVQQQISILMSSGSDLKTALSILADSAQPYRRMYITLMQERLPRGNNEANILDVGLLHKQDINYLDLVSGTQGFTLAMADIASTASQRATAQLQGATAVLRFALMGILCLLLFGLVKALTSPFSEITSMMYQ